MMSSISASLLFLILSVTFHSFIAEPCVEDNCQTLEKCDGVYDQGLCNNLGEACCRLVRPQFWTKCHQFGGECMTSCNPRIQEKSARDCPSGTICCILVS